MKSSDRSINQGWAVRWGFRLLLHLSAVALISLGFMSIFMTEAAWSLLPAVLSDGQVNHIVWTQALLLFGIAACFWSMIWIAVLYVRQSIRQRKQASVVRIRGSVLTETLIVFPVFLLLTFGLAQMAVNSIAGLLSTLGVYEAARTIAVWGPEKGHRRAGTLVSDAVIKEKARASVAGVMTPIAPILVSELASCDSQNKTVNDFLGSQMSLGVIIPTSSPTLGISSFMDALDTQSFGTRAWYKYRVAYCRTEVTWRGQIITDPRSRDRNEFTTELTYRHKTAFPLMNRVFGQYSDIKRSYVLTQQISPNPERPKQNAFRKLIGG